MYICPSCDEEVTAAHYISITVAETYRGHGDFIVREDQYHLDCWSEIVDGAYALAERG